MSVNVRNLTLNEDFDPYGRLVQRLGTNDRFYGGTFARNCVRFWFLARGQAFCHSSASPVSDPSVPGVFRRWIAQLPA
jgi:hypothetical protein